MVVVILLFIKKQNKKLMKFSELLPTFNGAKYLKTFIHSIFDQKYDDMELILEEKVNTDVPGRIV